MNLAIPAVMAVRNEFGQFGHVLVGSDCYSVEDDKPFTS